MTIISNVTKPYEGPGNMRLQCNAIYQSEWRIWRTGDLPVSWKDEKETRLEITRFSNQEWVFKVFQKEHSK